jgi:hypothetical protein
MRRLLPTAPAGSATRASLTAARGETTSFQIGVTAQAGALTGVRLRLTALQGPGGAIIPAARLVRYREHFVRIPQHSPNYEGPVLHRHWFPDALLPFVDPVTGKPPRSGARFRAEPFAVSAGHTQPLWVDVSVPRSAAAGRYTGRWLVTSDQGRAAGSVTLLVRDFTLPVHPAEASSFQIYHDRGHGQADDALLLRYGIQPLSVPPSQQALLSRRGLDMGNLGFSSGAYYGHCRMSAPPSVARLRRVASRQRQGLYLYNYTADEISKCKKLYPRVRTWARRLHAAGVDQEITMVPVPQVMNDGTGRLAVDDFTLLPEQFQHLNAGIRSRVIQRGGRFWSYQALVQGRRTPSWEIDFPAANYRILPGFLNAQMGVTGVLYWSVDFKRDPWHDITYRAGGESFPGEGTLLYPGAAAGDVGDVPSMRLAWIREGVDDFAYVQILRNLGYGRLAAQIMRPAASSWKDWTQSAAVLAAVRNRLATAIERHEDPAAPVTNPR